MDLIGIIHIAISESSVMATIVACVSLFGTTGYRKTVMTSHRCLRVFNGSPSWNSYDVDCSTPGRSSISSTSGGISQREYDYVVIGAGSAGCVIASKLVLGDKTARVLVAEAGPPADRSWKVRMPAALMYCLKNPRYSWCYETVPQVEITCLSIVLKRVYRFRSPGQWKSKRSTEPSLCWRGSAIALSGLRSLTDLKH